jgi:beta-glucosidase 2, glycosyl-hydrolase family 116 N-term
VGGTLPWACRSGRKWINSPWVVMALIGQCCVSAPANGQSSPASSVPFGGIGAGSFRIAADGRVQSLVLENNWLQPVQEAPGSFAAVSVRSGTTVETLAIQSRSGYRVRTPSSLDFIPQFPEAVFTAHTPQLDAMKVRVTVRWFSPLIPGDINQSCVPGAACIIRFDNQSDTAVSASAALSWEFASSRAAIGATRAEIYPAQRGYFGQILSRGGGKTQQALLVHPDNSRALVTTASWDASDALPPWWGSFKSSGKVSGAAETAKTGRMSAVVAATVSLKPRESVNIPFCTSWVSGPLVSPDASGATGEELDYGHLWERRSHSAVDTAIWMLDNWESALTLTEEWQKKLLNSSLPPDVSRRIIASAEPLFTRTILTSDGRFTAVTGENAASEGYLHARSSLTGLLLAFYPQLVTQELLQLSSLQSSAGSLPWNQNDWWARLGPVYAPAPLTETQQGQPPELAPGATANVQPAFVEPPPAIRADDAAELLLEAERVYRQTNNGLFLKGLLPLAESAVELFLAEPGRITALPATSRDRLYAGLRALARMASTGEEMAYEWTKASSSPAAAASDGLILEARLRRLAARCAAAQSSPAAQDPVTVLPDLLTASGDPPSPELIGSLHHTEGFEINLQSGVLNLTMPLPGTLRSLVAPIFAPTFAGTVQYRPNAHGGITSLRLDRTLVLNPVRSLKRRIGPSGAPQLVLKRVVVAGTPLRLTAAGKPIPNASVEVHVSLGSSPIGAAAEEQPDGTVAVIFAAPLTLTTGDRLEIDVHATPRPQ